MRSARLPHLMLILMLLVALITPAAVAADRPNLIGANLPKVIIEMDNRVMDFNGYMVDGRTMVPLRAIFEALGSDLKWDPEAYSITATKGATKVFLIVGLTDATVDGKPVTLAVPPVLIDSRTFVPLRFVAEALGAEVGWDAEAVKAIIKSGSDCAIAPFQVHEGTINAIGETWGRCGSPHIVKGTFRVEGVGSPILSIQEGAVVRFAEGANIVVGERAPGGLMVYGTEREPVLFTADSSGPQPGYWGGIHFFSQTLQNNTVIEHARLEYAGGLDVRHENGGAIVLNGDEKPLEIALKNVSIDNSLFAGIHLKEQARLKSGSAHLKITNTAQSDNQGGFPIVTNAYGSHNLPTGTYRPNAVTAINVNVARSANDKVTTNTTWKNLGVPYAISQTIWVEGQAAPTLTIEPGVISLWAPSTALYVGTWAPGSLVAESKGVTKAELDLGLKLANASAMAADCADCAKNKAIVFGSWNSSPAPGAWQGISLSGGAGDRSKMVGNVVAWGGSDETDFHGGIYMGDANLKAIKLLLADSLVTGSVNYGLFMEEGATLQPTSTGNFFTKNGIPVRVSLNSVGSIPAENDFSGNEVDAVAAGTGTHELTVSATWQKLNVPYRIEDQIWIGGTRSPKLTLKPGTTLIFTSGSRIAVGMNQPGDIVAVGTKDEPITFTGTAKRPGFWQGLSFHAGMGESALQHVIVEYAVNGVSIMEELGRFIEDSTFRNNAEYGIYREWDVRTSHVQGNYFSNNSDGDESPVE